MQKKRLAVLLAVAGIAGLLGVLGLRLWASSARLHMPQLAMAHTGADGNIYVMLADTLYVEDDEGHSLSVTPLSKFGLHGFWGDFAPLSDGGLILASQPQPADSAGKEIEIAMRTPVTAGQEDAEGVPLARCSVASGCSALRGSGGKYFKADRTFKLAVDEQAGRIYVADTAGQRLLILDMQGGILAQKTVDLRFPNQLTLTPKHTLLVTDTNDFRFLEFDVSGDTLAGHPVETSMQAWPGDVFHHFPTGVAQDVDGTRWAVLADDHIAHGELYRIPPGSETGTPVHLPAGDALYATVGDTDVLVPDMATYRIYRFGRDGSALPDFGSPTLTAALAPLATQRAIYDVIFRYSLAAMVAMLLLLLLAQHVSKLAKIDGDLEPPQPLGQVAAQFTVASGTFGTPGWRGSRYVFRRRLSGALRPNDRRWLLIIVLLCLGTGAALVLLMTHDLATPSHHSFSADRAHSDAVAFVVVTIVGIVYALLSIRYERLYLDQTGIRYQTPLAGPFSFLAPLYPSWSVRWDELQALRLSNGAGGGLAQQWYYELETRDGKVRRVGALQWRRADVPDETTLSFRDARQRNPELLHAAITRTALYQLMSLARKSVEVRNAPTAPVT